MKRAPSRARLAAPPAKPLSVVLVGLAFVLALLGLFFIFEASSAESYRLVGHQYFFLRQQAVSLGIGLGALFVGWWLPSSVWKKMAPWLFLGGVVLLIAVLIPGIGVELNGAKRWLSLQGRLFQPVEFFKLALVLFSAVWMTKRPKPGAFVFLTALFSLLVILQPDMGSLLVLLGIAFGMFFVAGGRLMTLAAIGAAGGLLLMLLAVTSPYRLERLTTYFNPESDPLGSGFHVRQLTLALAHGGWFGVGIGNSQQKYDYIPEASSDSIFAIVAEELGFVGALLILVLLVSYLVVLYKVGAQLPEKSFERLAALGVFVWLSSQAILNLSAVVVLVPLTGVPLPFFSSGGTALIVTLLATGMVAKLAQPSVATSVTDRKKVQ